ncbi:oligosaccharide flippase family protein [bacterium]|nr:oligosaccharide flippase family protein [bacterium]
MTSRRLFLFLPVTATGAVASFGAVYAFTRLMTPETYGWYALAYALMSFVHTGVITWAEAAAYRFAGDAEQEGKAESHARAVFGLVARGAAAAALVALAAAAIAGDGEARPAFAFAALVLVTLPFFNALQEIRKATFRSARYAVDRMALDLGGLALGVWLVWTSGLGAGAPFLAMALVAGALAVAGWAPLGRAMQQATPPTREQLNRYAAFGWPVTLALVFNLVLTVGDRFMIAFFLGPEAVGAYAAGYGVADRSIAIIFAWGATAMSPVLLAAWRESDLVGLRAASRDYARTLLVAATPAAVGVALVARPVGEVLVGEALRTDAVAIIPWIAAAAWFGGFALHYFSEAFQLNERTRERALWLIGPTVLNLGLNAALIPAYGLSGAVAATVASYAAAFAALGWRSSRLAPLAWPLADAAKVAAACGVMALVIVALPSPGGWPELLLKAGAGAAVYGAAALALDAGGVRQWLRRRPAGPVVADDARA